MVYLNPGRKGYPVIPLFFLGSILFNNYIGLIPETTVFTAYSGVFFYEIFDIFMISNNIESF